MTPDLLCIGAEKSGTTWLWSRLITHPDVNATPLKEICYFTAVDLAVPTDLRSMARGGHWIHRRWRAGIRHQLLHDLRRRNWHEASWDRRYFFGRRSDNWYRSLFEGIGPGLTMDFTPNYSALSEDGVDHVRKTAPDAKIVMLLRNPIDRAWSATKMSLAGSAQRDFACVTNEEIEQYLSSDWESALGDYARTIGRWRAAYGEERVFVGFYDDVLGDPEALLRNVCAFAGLSWNAAVGADAQRRVNVGASESPMPDFAVQLLTDRYVPIMGRLRDELADVRGVHHVDSWLAAAGRDPEEPTRGA